MNRLNTLARSCREHPQSVGQSYWEHFWFSFSFSARLLVAASTAFVHALVPGVFETTTSRAIDQLHERIHHQTDKAQGQ
ncbi:MAG: hypothetical protein ACI9XK_002312 [Granulosicoccus sp.]|jgi:hypothetical protein